MRKLTDAEWMLKHAVTASGCWEWTGLRSRKNYGLIERYGGFGTKRGRKQISAHRESWRFHRGEIPDGMFVLHRCDNPPCINPEHLFLGTSKDNQRDMVNKGRNFTMRGTAHPRAKLTDETVLEVARAVVAGRGKAEVARHFGVSVSLVRWIASGHRWRHVTSGIIDHVESTCALCRRNVRRGIPNPQGFVPAVPLLPSGSPLA